MNLSIIKDLGTSISRVEFLREAASVPYYFFINYGSRLLNIVEKYLPSVQGYADYTWLYMSFFPGSGAPQDEAVRSMESCLADSRA